MALGYWEWNGGRLVQRQKEGTSKCRDTLLNRESQGIQLSQGRAPQGGVPRNTTQP